MTLHLDRRAADARGFSLIELLVVVAIIAIVLSAMLAVTDQAQQRAMTERGKVDDLQQARDFIDQIFRDTREMGYPNVHNFDISQGTWQSPLINDRRLAAGLVQLTPTQLEFQGDVDGSGTVSVVSYAVNGNGNCANCLERAQVLKLNGDPITGQLNLTTASYAAQVQYVENVAAIFSAFDVNGNAITLGGGINIVNNPALIERVRTIQVQLSIARPSALDPQTGQQLEADISGRVQVSNCSMAGTGLAQIDSVQITCQ
jgi:prepilin-type N-terminal cleavage/methylation domain-containing protein